MTGFRRACMGVGIGGLLIAATSAAMFGVALARGIHCPECDRWQLGGAYDWWASYFHVLELLSLFALPPAIVGAALGAKRWYGVVGLVLAVGLTMFRPR